jgi:LmbE family N-acetylglucosaminyl deacetylase
MIPARRTATALIVSAAVLLGVSCRSAAPGAAVATSCDNEALTAHPALLVLAPHPDDETLGFTGLIDAYLRAGKPVTVVVVTDGDAYCEACRFWKSNSVTGPMCSAEELSNFATAEIDSLAEVRRSESAAAAKILGLPAPRFLGYPDTGLAAAWRNLGESKPAEPLHRSDFSGCTSCATCGYGEGPRTALTAETLMASLRELIAAQPDGALLATTHWLDGHADHAALGQLVRRVNEESASPHAIAYAVIHAFTKNTANADCWYPAPAAPDCPCMDDEEKALADPGWVARSASRRFRPDLRASLPRDADYGAVQQLCLPERLYAGDVAVKLRMVRSYASQLGRLARTGSHPAALNGIIDCNGYLPSFVRRTETFVLVEPRG